MIIQDTYLKSKIVKSYSLICRDCNEYIFKGKEKLKDGVYVDDSFYSEAVCDECLENYPYCEKHDQYNFQKEN